MAQGMTAVRQDPMARLDAWVMEELEALSRPKARPPERPKRRREAELEPAAFDAPADEGPLPMDENQFVQRVTEWLSGRPNADLILEEIWRNVVVPEADEALADDLSDDAFAGEPGDARLAANDGDPEGAADPPEGPAADAADPSGDDRPQA